MGQIISTVLLIPLVLWSVFQPILFHNASLTRETIKISLYEIQKEASLNGQYDADLYVKFKEMLVENHGYNPSCIQITGTENLTERGEELEVKVTIPKPMMSFMDVFSMGSCERPDSYTPYVVYQTINSEYIP